MKRAGLYVFAAALCIPGAAFAAADDCTAAQLQTIRTAQKAAWQRVFNVYQIVKPAMALTPHGADVRSERAKKLVDLGKAIFEIDLREYKDSAREVLNKMQGMLANTSLSVKCPKAGSKGCSFEGFVEGSLPPINLCPLFFAPKSPISSRTAEERRIQTMIHESAHLAKVLAPKATGEAYCQTYTCTGKCNGSDDAWYHADNWLQLVHCVTQSPEAADKLTGKAK